MKSSRDLLTDKLAADLQLQGANAFDESWGKLLEAIKVKGKTLAGSAQGKLKPP